MLDIFLVRHAATAWNYEPRVMGDRPIPITDRGASQVRALASWLKEIPITACYSSPVLRATQTAEILLEGLPRITLAMEDGLGEIDYGKWVGLSFEEVRLKYPRLWENYFRKPSLMQIPGGETMASVQKRAVACVEKIRAKHPEGKVLLVSHADVIKSIVVHYLGIPLDDLQRVSSENGALSILRLGSQWGDRLMALNYLAPMDRLFRE